MKKPKPRGAPPTRPPEAIKPPPIIDPESCAWSGDARLHQIAGSFARHVITPTIAAAAETYPELSISEILPLCEPALARELTFELESACQEAIRASHAGSSATE